MAEERLGKPDEQLYSVLSSSVRIKADIMNPNYKMEI
jgi:hypothetical protein